MRGSKKPLKSSGFPFANEDTHISYSLFIGGRRQAGYGAGMEPADRYRYAVGMNSRKRQPLQKAAKSKKCLFQFPIPLLMTYGPMRKDIFHASNQRRD